MPWAAPCFASQKMKNVRLTLYCAQCCAGCATGPRAATQRRQIPAFKHQHMSSVSANCRSASYHMSAPLNPYQQVSFTRAYWARSGLEIAPARLDAGLVSNTPGLNNLLQQLLQHSWQERPSPVQAQHILTQAQHLPNQAQSNRAAHSVLANPAKQYVSLQDIQAAIAALPGIR